MFLESCDCLLKICTQALFQDLQAIFQRADGLSYTGMRLRHVAAGPDMRAQATVQRADCLSYTGMRLRGLICGQQDNPAISFLLKINMGRRPQFNYLFPLRLLDINLWGATIKFID